MGLDFDQLFPGKYMKAGEFKGRDVTVTIKSVELTNFGTDADKEMKAAVFFTETKKGLVLNKTNGVCLRAMFGRNAGAWVGKKVTLFPAQVSFGDTDLAIRVRGSPELSGPIEFTTKIGLKSATFKLIKTGKAAPKAPAAPVPPTPPPEPEPDFNPDTGEVPFGDS